MPTQFKKSREKTVKQLMEYDQRSRHLSPAEQKEMANLLIKGIEVFHTHRVMAHLRITHFSAPIVSCNGINMTKMIPVEYPTFWTRNHP